MAIPPSANIRGQAANDAPAALSANDLLSGRVTWWDGFGWKSSFAEAAVARDASAREALAAIGRSEETANVVVGALLVPLDHRDRPSGLREARRLAGPSVSLPTPLPVRPDGMPHAEA